MSRVTIPDPPGLEAQLRAHVKALWRVILGMAIAILAVAALTAYGFIQADTATHQAANTARAEAKLAQQVARTALQSTRAIKAERNDYVRRSCRDQNRRHRNTIRYIHRFGVHQAHRQHIRIKTAERRLRPFVLLMDAAIPHRNCRQAVARARGIRP